MKKEALIKSLEKSLLCEEKAIPLYSKHINNTLFLSKFSEKDKDRVRKVLELLAKDSDRHMHIFEGLIEKVKKEEGKDVH